MGISSFLLLAVMVERGDGERTLKKYISVQKMSKCKWGLVRRKKGKRVAGFVGQRGMESTRGCMFLGWSLWVSLVMIAIFCSPRFLHLSLSGSVAFSVLFEPKRPTP